MTFVRRALPLLALLLPFPLFAGFSGKDLFVPASARGDGAYESHYFTNVWITNLQAASPVTVTAKLLALNGAANPAATASLTLAAGETRRVDDVIGTLFSLPSGAGAIRFQSTGEILVSSRTYNQPTGTTPDQSTGLFLAGIPASFAVAKDETTTLQGVTQGANENFRYNYGLVETVGQPITVRVVLRDEAGAQKGSADVPVPAYGAVQFNVGDRFPGTAMTGGRLDVTVIAGGGRLIAYGTQIVNGSNDSSGFEMSFRDDLLSDKGLSAAEDVSGSSGSSAVSAADASFKTGTTLTATGPIRPTAAIPPVYDPITGLWTVQITLSTGQSGTAKIGFSDAQGNAQRYYNPVTTTRMTATGQAYGPQGNVSFDLVLTGVNAASPSLTVNGSGSGSARGTSGTFTASNVVMPKSAGSWPTSGTVTVQAVGVTVTIAFNGTSTVTGTYSYLNQTRTFTIDLATGEVTR